MHVFASAFGKRSNSDDYLWYLDYRDSGRIWIEDLAMFLLRFGRSS